MNIGKVVGSVVSTQKDDSLVGKKLMIVQLLDQDFQLTDSVRVAADTVGAGIDELVLLTSGASARRICVDSNGKEATAVDCAIVGIIDSFEK